MKEELSIILKKAQRYDEALERMKSWARGEHPECFTEAQKAAEYIFPELAESEDEKIRKALIDFFNRGAENGEQTNGICDKDILTWLEKQDGYSIYSVPSREVILAIWDLGNEWKELTNGGISTEYGTQLDYIQKHWTESEYYLRKKQGEQKPTLDFNADNGYVSKVDDQIHDMTYNSADKVEPKFDKWSEEDEDYINDLIRYFSQNERMKNTKEDIVIWLKSLRPQKQWKPSNEQIRALHDLNLTGNISYAGQSQTLINLYNDLKRLEYGNTSF